ncbi:hypothetical protein [Paracoccus sp. pheM1]|uniref:hypothetical protein n=1 Tax=Paracoccus sp. pheM1 TaxID=2831675 RepID=UPI001BDB922A|nr:hypothetical protein [Paracoccus sp. pheM1]MBT0779255.1 hypothetical protein [Paracoccus sp. pheM1]
MDGTRSIARRTTHLRLSKEAARLNVEEIAIVLDISTKQVSRDMVAAYKNIRNDLNDWRAVG